MFVSDEGILTILGKKNEVEKTKEILEELNFDEEMHVDEEEISNTTKNKKKVK
jgi:hypothetical protein